MQLTNLEQSKKLKAWGAPQETGSYWLEAGHKYGDGYGREADELTKEKLIVLGEGKVGIGEIGDWDYEGESPCIEFPCIKFPEYGSDNYYEYPLSACYAAYSLGDLIDWLPWGILVHKSEDGTGTAIWDRENLCKKGKNPLEAVFNLAEAIHSKKGE